jgi:hypothetical protein
MHEKFNVKQSCHISKNCNFKQGHAFKPPAWHGLFLKEKKISFFFDKKVGTYCGKDFQKYQS